ncbi:BatA and WFA domain-containing protein [Postechiella marina]|uniref:BatA and WFA domain-containing protein n=1 Tax=Postechiella marina TaxID=943941 RepID=A0ABP8CD42_9FLAO
MQFKHPELLYALFLLLIPVIVHLFQLRKFEKVAFTNVAFLKHVVLQTRKSAQLKKWLTLCVRLLLLAAIILAFAQPYTSKNNSFKTKNETVIYLDNSFSLQAKGNKGELLNRAIQDIISNVTENDKFTLITNNKTYKNTTIKSLKNDLLQLGFSSNSIPYQSAFIKAKTFFSKQNNTKKHIIFISDFQKNSDLPNIKPDSVYKSHFIQLKPVNINNIAIDSVYISQTTAANTELTVLVKNTGVTIENIPISLYNNDKLIAKTSVSINKSANTTFTLPTNTIINGKVVINDANLSFDNTLFFNINKPTKTNILSINAANHSFLKRIYTSDEFNYTATKTNELNYNLINKQHVIILNELETIPNALINALKGFTSQGGYLVIIPSKTSNTSSYSGLLSNYQIVLNGLVENEKRITSINYNHPLFNNDVFEKEVKNFQYPKVNSHFNTTLKNGSSVLKYEDGNPFLVQSNNTYLFLAAINSVNSNFTNSPLIVPTLYNIGKNSLKSPILYYNIGKENNFDVVTSLQQDDVLKLVNNDINIIPMQQYFNNKVSIKTTNLPNQSGIYTIKSKTETIKNVSYNYNRTESNLNYHDISALKNITSSNSITKIFDTIKSNSKINALWKWFVIFALVLLIIEMLILKYFK